MNTLTQFAFESRQVRVSVGDDGQPWFNANDVCEALTFTNPRKALSDHVDEEDVTKRDTLTYGGVQQANYVNESGLYALIFGSTKPEAKKFKRWVTSEVLPAIRKTGEYRTKPTTLLRIYQASIGGVTTLAVDARELWRALSAKPEFSSWLMRRANRYGFHQGRDFGLSKCSRPKEFDVSVDMAHYLAFVEGRIGLSKYLRCCWDRQALRQLRAA